MNIEGILGSAKFVTFLAVISLTGGMVNLYMVPHIGCLRTCISTVIALPQPIHVLPHLVLQFNICTFYD